MCVQWALEHHDWLLRGRVNILKMVIFIKSINFYNIHFLNFENYHKLGEKKTCKTENNALSSQGPRQLLGLPSCACFQPLGEGLFREAPSAGRRRSHALSHGRETRRQRLSQRPPGPGTGRRNGRVRVPSPPGRLTRAGSSVQEERSGGDWGPGWGRVEVGQGPV